MNKKPSLSTKTGKKPGNYLDSDEPPLCPPPSNYEFPENCEENDFSDYYSEMVMLVDCQGNIVSANYNAHDFLGYANGDLLNLNYSHLASKRAGESNPYIDEALKKGEPVDGQEVWVHKEGGSLLVNVSLQVSGCSSCPKPSPGESHPLLWMISKPVLSQENDLATEQGVYSQLEINIRSHELDEYGALTGNSAKITELKRKIAKVARSNSNVLIVGESGTGKAQAAKLLHDLSPRKSQSFNMVSCAFFSNQELLSYHLFGDANHNDAPSSAGFQGVLEESRGGTILLQDIEIMSLSCQKMFLRRLEGYQNLHRQLQQQSALNVKLIVASNDNLKKMVADGLLREDLYDFISVVTLYAPALRERAQDIKLLVKYYAKLFSRSLQKKCSFTDTAVQEIARSLHRTNLRSLRKMIQGTMELSDNNIINASDILSYRASEKQLQTSIQSTPNTFKSQPETNNQEKVLLGRIKFYLESGCHTKQEIADKIGISRTTLWRKIKKLGASSDNSE